MSEAIDIGDGLHLSEIRFSDKPAYMEHFKEKDISDRTLTIPYPYTEKDADWWLAHVAEETAGRGGPLNWAVRRPDGYLIGAAGFSGLTESSKHVAELGYWLARPYRGRGIMTSVVRRLCGAAFSGMKLVRITAHVFPFNAASSRVLEKCGFKLEGLLRKHALKNGAYLDCSLYALVKE